MNTVDPNESDAIKCRRLIRLQKVAFFSLNSKLPWTQYSLHFQKTAIHTFRSMTYLNCFLKEVCCRLQIHFLTIFFHCHCEISIVRGRQHHTCRKTPCVSRLMIRATWDFVLSNYWKNAFLHSVSTDFSKFKTWSIAVQQVQGKILTWCIRLEQAWY